jgi:hypothetical protein
MQKALNRKINKILKQVATRGKKGEEDIKNDHSLIEA